VRHACPFQLLVSLSMTGAPWADRAARLHSSSTPFPSDNDVQEDPVSFPTINEFRLWFIGFYCGLWGFSIVGFLFIVVCGAFHCGASLCCFFGFSACFLTGFFVGVFLIGLFVVGLFHCGCFLLWGFLVHLWGFFNPN
jgi:hypothetical protein